MAELMRAAVCEAYGPPSSLVIREIPEPTPGRDEVLVAVEFASVNYPDVLFIADRYQVSMPTPFVPGSEFSGVVVEIGPDVTTVDVGDRVFGTAMTGAYAERVVAPSSNVHRIPDGVAPDVAAGFRVAYLTAYHALRSLAQVTSGERVVVLGAAGGVGLATVELASLLGAEVVAAASTAEKLEIAGSRGARHLVDYAGTDLRESLRELFPDGVDIVIDPVGGPQAERALRALRWKGRFVTIGFASGEIPRIPLNLVLLKGCVVMGYEIRTFADNEPELAARDEREAMELLAHGRLRPHVSRAYSLDEVGVALDEVAGRRSTGKVLLKP